MQMQNIDLHHKKILICTKSLGVVRVVVRCAKQKNLSTCEVVCCKIAQRELRLIFTSKKSITHANTKPERTLENIDQARMAQQKPSISSFLPDDCIPKATSTQIDVQSRCSIPRDADAEYKRIATKSKIPSNSGHSIDTASKNEEDQLVMRRKGMATRWAILMFVSVTLGFDEYW